MASQPFAHAPDLMERLSDQQIVHGQIAVAPIAKVNAEGLLGVPQTFADQVFYVPGLLGDVLILRRVKLAPWS